MFSCCCGSSSADDDANQRPQHKPGDVPLGVIDQQPAPATAPVSSKANNQGLHGVSAASVADPSSMTGDVKDSKESSEAKSASSSPVLTTAGHAAASSQQSGPIASQDSPDSAQLQKTSMPSGTPVMEAKLDTLSLPDPVVRTELPSIDTELAQEAPPLLSPVRDHLTDRKCLVLDLDETLVHSSFRYIHEADFVIPVEIDGQYHSVYVIKRPGVDEFLRRVGELFEVVVFTASVAKYGDPLLSQLDIHKVVHHRLFRDACMNFGGNYVKDLSRLGRQLDDVIIIDNSPTSYLMHQQHAIPISSWFSDAHDNELLDMIPFLEQLSSVDVPNVTLILDTAIEEEHEEEEGAATTESAMATEQEPSSVRAEA